MSSITISDKLGFFLVLGLAWLVALEANADSDTYQNEFFRLTLPDGFQVKERVHAEDYFIYNVIRNNRSFVHLYVGAQPDYSSLTFKPSPDTSTHFSSPNVDMVSAWKNHHLTGRKLLLRLETPQVLPWPKYIMVWTDELSEQDINVADEILGSLIVLKGNNSSVQ